MKLAAAATATRRPTAVVVPGVSSRRRGSILHRWVIAATKADTVGRPALLGWAAVSHHPRALLRPARVVIGLAVVGRRGATTAAASRGALGVPILLTEVVLIGTNGWRNQECIFFRGGTTRRGEH